MSRAAFPAVALLCAVACGAPTQPTQPAPTPAAAASSSPQPSAPPTPTTQGNAPRIVSMRFDTLSLPTDEDCPLPGELAAVYCEASDEDDDVETMSLELEVLGTTTFSPQYPTRVVQRQPPRSGMGRRRIEARFELTRLGARPSVRATCEVVDATGLRDVRVRTCT